MNQPIVIVFIPRFDHGPDWFDSGVNYDGGSVS